MDTTPKYIKMWLTSGIEIEIDPIGPFVCPKCYAVTNDEGLPVTEWCDCEELVPREPLPRQDQLQEMVGLKGWQGLMAKFSFFLDPVKLNELLPEPLYKKMHEERSKHIKYTNLFSSMEQLWLAFVMHEKYGKVWDDKKEEWVKIS